MSQHKKENGMITIDKLAQMVQRGFDSLDKKFEVINTKFVGINQVLQVIIDRLDSLEGQVTQVKLTLNSLVRMAAMRDKELKEFDLRLRRVERRLGLLNT